MLTLFPGVPKRATLRFPWRHCQVQRQERGLLASTQCHQWLQFGRGKQTSY
jgi:hypothetical protein